MKSLMTLAFSACCGLLITASSFAADRINPGLYSATHKFADFEIRITNDGASARGKDPAAKNYTSWKKMKMKDKGSRLRYKAFGYNLKINKNAIKAGLFKGHLTAVGVNFGLLTFHKK